MKKVINVMKNCVKWYFDQVAKTYVMTPTGMIIPRDC